jgi:alanine dehydrogenase
MASGATCIAYETVTDGDDELPLLARMSQAVGRMAIQAGHNTSKPSMAVPISYLGESRGQISQGAH